MKLGVFADVHANLPALQAVIDALHAQDVDKMACVGDIVGVLGSPNEVVELVREECGPRVVFGNHDSRVFEDRQWLPHRDVEVTEHNLVMDSLTDENLEWLRNLPGMYVSGQDNFTLAHSRPDPTDPAGCKQGDAGVHPGKFISVGAEYVDGGILLIGHTHYQHAVRLDKFAGQSGLVLNPGSVGHPVEARANFAVVDTETLDYQLGEVGWDNEDVISHLIEHGVKFGSARRRKRSRLI